MDIRFSLVAMPLTELIMDRQRRGCGPTEHHGAFDPLARGEHWPLREGPADHPGYPWEHLPPAAPVAATPRSQGGLLARAWQAVRPARTA